MRRWPVDFKEAAVSTGGKIKSACFVRRRNSKLQLLTSKYYKVFYKTKLNASLISTPVVAQNFKVLIQLSIACSVAYESTAAVDDDGRKTKFVRIRINEQMPRFEHSGHSRLDRYSVTLPE